MGTVSVSDLYSIYSKFINEAIQDYAEKSSSFSAQDLELLSQHVTTYCMEKVAKTLPQIPEHNHKTEKREEILKEEKCLEQDKYSETAQMLQSSAAPSETEEFDNEIGQEISEEEKCFEQGKCMETAEIQESATASYKNIIDGDQFTKLIAYHKQQQEFQEKIFKTLLDQLQHQHTQQEQNLQQQIKIYEQFLQQQQDFQAKTFKALQDQLEHQHTRQEQSQLQQNKVYEQLLQQQDFLSRLMGEFMGHKGKTEQPVHDNHVDVDRKPQDPSCSEGTYNSSRDHNSGFGRGSSEKSAPSSHFHVANRDRQPTQVFDCHELGKQFCEWFYSRLNSQNPTDGQERLELDPNILWNDANFFFVHDNSYEEYLGAESVIIKLLEMTQEQKLTFTPELDSERFKCVNSKHGLVMVAVTGKICNNKDYSGVFRQLFGLIKCPHSGYFKIKTISLRVNNIATLISMPPVSAPPLQYTTEQLQEFKIEHAQKYL